MSSNHDLSRGQTFAVEGMARLAVPTKLTRLVLGFCFLLPTSFAQAATITHAKLDATTEIIRIEGDIVTGDLEQFRQISLRYPKAVVSLNSNGGLVQPAIEIGKIIKIMGYSTMVLDRYTCASACALIWMAGSRRLASGRGNVGFHASYRTDNGRPVESGAANALIGNYLTLLGASARTVVFTTTAPPDKVLWLTAANKETSGIDFQFTAPVQPQAAASTPKPPQIQTIVRPRVPATAPPAPSVRGSQQQVPLSVDLFNAPPNWQWSSAPSAPWVFVAAGASGSKYYINQMSFVPYTYSGTGWGFIVKIDFSSVKNSSTHDSIEIMQINCERVSQRSILSINYDKSGNVISSFSEDSHVLNKLSLIVPDTVSADIYEAVCQ